MVFCLKVYFVNGVCLIKVNIEVCNGVIYVIYKVLLLLIKIIYDVINFDFCFLIFVEVINVIMFVLVF